MKREIALNIPYAGGSFSRGVALAGMRAVRKRTRHLHWHIRAPVLSVVMWVCLWTNLNSGFWNIQAPYSADDWQLLLRALLPFAVLPVAAFVFFRRAKSRLSWNGPSTLLMMYGVMATLAAVFSHIRCGPCIGR